MNRAERSREQKEEGEDVKGEEERQRGARDVVITLFEQSVL